jgi:recombination protein RecT
MSNSVSLLKQSVASLAPEFKAALPSHISVDKFVRVAQTAILSNPDLQNADKASLFGACVKLAQDGLLPDGQEAALVTFNSKGPGGNGWVKKAQAMPMIKGLLKKIRQSGEVAYIDAHVVHENDHFQYRPGIDDQPIFEPDWFGDRGKPIGAFAVARLKTGEIIPAEVMSAKDIEKVRAASRGKDRGPWVDWWDQMALKTVMRRYAKRLPSSSDIEEMMEKDETMAYRAPIVEQAREEPPVMISAMDAIENEIEEVEVVTEENTNG